MSVILQVHAETYRSLGPIANPRHNGLGHGNNLKTANLIKLFVRRFRQDGGNELKRLYACTGYRCEEILSAVEQVFFPDAPDGSSTIPPDVKMGTDFSLGDASSTRSRQGKMYTLGENIFPAKDCVDKEKYLARISRWLGRHHSIVLSPKDLEWGNVEELDLECPGLKILCGGRNEMKCLGEIGSFRLASAYLLDWQKRKAYRFVTYASLTV